MTDNAEKNVIMVIEDEMPLLLAIQKKLQLSGFDAVTATDGKQALDYLKSLLNPPSLIWLDYYLPSLNGIDFLKEIRKDPKLASIPVFVVSNTAGPDKIKSMLELGVGKYFFKAEKRLDEIIGEIQTYLKKGR